MAASNVGPSDAASMLRSARLVASNAAAGASDDDRDAAFPTDGIRHLHETGLLRAAFPASCDGHDRTFTDTPHLREILTTIGRGSLPLGRLYEGHVNAVAVVARYGSSANLRLLKAEADAGRPSGVWMAGDALRLERAGTRFVLRGRKILCSGAGHFRRPLAAADVQGGSVMLIPNVEPRRADSSAWTAHGMRATATGTVDFEGIEVGEDEIVGKPGDYLRSPWFRGGAWRVIAVQLGGLEAVLDHYRAQLDQSPHRDNPIQLARFGEASIAFETARLWVREASEIAEGPFDDADAVDAYVDLARNAFEMAALRLVGLAQKAIGLKAFLRPNPMERIIRDLTTYMRQPALDMSLISGAAFNLRAAQDRT